MAGAVLAWSARHLFRLPDDSHLYGREFELLPAGTMFAASVILHGIIGVPAVVDAENIVRIADDAELCIHPVRDTDACELQLHESDISEAYRLKELQDTQG